MSSSEQVDCALCPRNILHKEVARCLQDKKQVVAEFFLTHKERMRYEKFHKAKLPLGSGAVES